jgi:DNA transformation protein
MLAGAGIKTLVQLKRLGSVRAYAKVKATGVNTSLNLLWALEGALTDLPWQTVAREHRLSLLLALEALNDAGRADENGARLADSPLPPAGKGRA